MGAGAPAKRAAWWMAPALPVFAGMPAPTGLCGHLARDEAHLLRQSFLRYPSTIAEKSLPPSPRKLMA
ncbi:hypothetical protein DMX12_25260 [Pseudomonas sp. MB-090624]|nr:hypothetical protein DMX12_25260 [Pseudomonas sp. MB-090624]